MILQGLSRLLNRSTGDPTIPSNRWFPFTPLIHDGEATPLGLPSFHAGVDRKGSMVGSLPVYTEANGQRRDFVPPILFRPDPSEERFTTLHKMVQSFVYCGELVAPITAWSEDGFPLSLVVVDPSLVQLSDDGLTWKAGTTEWPRSEVLHLVRFPLPGVWRGVGAVQLHRKFFQGVEAQERFQREFYLNGGVPSIVVSMAEDASPDDIDEAERRWVDKTTQRKPLFVPHALRADSFSLSNEDQQYLQSKQLTLQEIANIVGLPGAYLGAPNASQTYQNIQDTRRELIDVYLRPDIVLLEAGFSALLADGLKAKLDTNALLRTDPKATADLLIAELEYKTMNEVRAELGLPPVAGGDVIGKHYTVPVAESDAQARALSVAEVLQKVYLAVGVVITAEEAREIVNANGGQLTGPGPVARPQLSAVQEGAA